MNASTKEKIGCDVICRTHSAKIERDMYRLCPSKLSKRELEDLYFALLENNLELKKTVNVQQDKIKVLSTKMQRIAVLQKGAAGKEKDCCASKAILNEHKESILNLKNTNEHMADRIRVLNMRLCSAKQFLKQSPAQGANNKCARCSLKNSSLSALNGKRTSTTIRTPAVSCQSLAKNDVSARSSKTVETAIETPEKPNPEKPCNENKCSSIMNEMKEKIVNLQEELSKSHEEYSQRISKLETQVSDLQDENLRVRSDHVASKHALQQRTKNAEELADKLRVSDAKCNELAMKLSIEKRRVQELETGLKLASRLNHVVDTIELLAASNEDKSETDGLRPDASSPCYSQNIGNRSPTKILLAPSPKKDEVKFASRDDSGYCELNKSCDTDEESVVAKINKQLLKKIAELQTKLDMITISAAGEVAKSKNVESNDVEANDIAEAEFQMQLIPAPIVIEEPIVKKDSTSMPKILIDNNTSQKDIASPPANEEAGSSKHYEDLITGSHQSLDRDREYDKYGQGSVNSITFKDEVLPTPPASVDDHNRYQIPGPIPINPPSSKDQRKTLKTLTTNDSRTGTKKKIAYEEKAVKILENSKDSYLINDKDFDNEPCNISGSNMADNETVECKFINEKQSKSVNNLGSKPMDTSLGVNDSVIVSRKRLSKNDNQNYLRLIDNNKLSSSSVLLKCDNAVQVDSILDGKQQATQIKDNVNKYAFCESHATICRCPALQKRDVAVFRSCSGTLRFRTTSPTNLRQCGCHANTDSIGTQMDKRSVTVGRDSATYTAPNTYAIPGSKCERATSPDNTENEISTMSDLPSEKDSKSPRLRRSLISPTLSPGEEKATMTSTDTNTNTENTDYGSLSEGELPAAVKVRRLSTGERLPDSMLSPTRTATSERMEATLQSISEELARCRQLLLSQRPERESQEPKRSNVRSVSIVPKVPSELKEDDHALRLSAANSKIAGTNAPSCTFTLHVSTLVLSDEAMLNLRDKLLIMTWKFYMQNEAMTRIQPGRVCVFDFVTEYAVTIDEEFMEYMKREDLLIELCELDYKKRALAVCSVPLREALLHVNQRTDMSLVLTPHSATGRTGQSFGDEFGVLDLWCMLTVEPAFLPTLNHFMQSISGQNPQKYARPSEDIHMSFDMDGSARYDDEVEYRRHSSQTQISVPTSDLGHKTQVGFGTNRRNTIGSTGMIVSDLVSTFLTALKKPASIKNAEEMKHALDRNLQRNPTRMTKIDDDARSSIGSVKSLATKQMSKARSAKKFLNKDIAEYSQLSKRDKASSLAGISADGYVKDVSDPYIIKQYNNIGKGHLTNILNQNAVNKLVDVSKKSVKYTDSTLEEEKQRTTSLDKNEDSYQTIDITILWLALNEECEAMVNPNIQQLYVAYSFLGRHGADLETPVSLPKPKHYADKCYFNFKKTFQLQECDLPLLGHMARSHGNNGSTDPRDCLVFTLVSEPPEDPLGLSTCEDIGYAYLYFGDVLAYSGDSSDYTEVIGVRGVRGGICGVLAVKIENLSVMRRCLTLSLSHQDLVSEH